MRRRKSSCIYSNDNDISLRLFIQYIDLIQIHIYNLNRPLEYIVNDTDQHDVILRDGRYNQG